ncbi:MAG: glycosyl hydrolase family 65 protein, partial [Humibacillus sp.]
ARMWTDLGFWLGRGEGRRFHLHGVTGPDEYTTVVNNNLFTNVMAKDNLRQAARWTRRLREEFPEAHARLVARLDLDDHELDEWAECAEGMYVPFDAGLRVHPQDQHFLEREVWDLAATPDSKRPLLLHYHPLVIYRFQVLKQADVVAALFLQGQLFTNEEKLADFEYYDPLTTGDSSLSSVVQSIVAAEVGYRDLAIEYFHAGLFVDLADLHGNAADGVHVASTGGVWNSLVYGFGGLRDHNGTLTFDPRLPVAWPALTFRLQVRGSSLLVTVERERISFTVRSGDALEVLVRGTRVRVEQGQPAVVGLVNQGPVIAGRLGSLPLVGASNEHEMVYTAGVPDPDRQQRRRRESGS